MPVIQYGVTRRQLHNIFDYMEDMVVANEAVRVLNSRGLVVYHVPIADDEFLTETENTVLILDFIANKIRTSANDKSSQTSRSVLERLIGKKLEAIDL